MGLDELLSPGDASELRRYNGDLEMMMRRLRRRDTREACREEDGERASRGDAVPNDDSGWAETATQRGCRQGVNDTR